jgi:hypothetical protein
MIQTNAWLTPRHVIDQAGPWNTMRNPDDDGEFFCRAVLAGKGIRYTAGGVNYYRKFSQNKTWSTRRDHATRSAVLQSWILKSRHLEPYLDFPGISRALAINFTKLCYDNYPAYPDLSKQAMQLAIPYGGLQGAPYFGNRLYNKWSRFLPWKMALQLQYIYQQLKPR